VERGIQLPRQHVERRAVEAAVADVDVGDRQVRDEFLTPLPGEPLALEEGPALRAEQIMAAAEGHQPPPVRLGGVRDPPGVQQAAEVGGGLLRIVVEQPVILEVPDVEPRLAAAGEHEPVEVGIVDPVLGAQVVVAVVAGRSLVPEDADRHVTGGQQRAGQQEVHQPTRAGRQDHRAEQDHGLAAEQHALNGQVDEIAFHAAFARRRRAGWIRCLLPPRPDGRTPVEPSRSRPPPPPRPPAA